MAEAAAIEIVAHVRVKEIGVTELGKTAGLLGRGMCDNPADLRLFRIGDRERRIRALARFFEPVLRSLYARGLILGAFRDSTLAGVYAMARPGFCQATAFEKLQLAPTVILGKPHRYDSACFEMVRRVATPRPSRTTLAFGPGRGRSSFSTSGYREHNVIRLLRLHGWIQRGR